MASYHDFIPTEKPSIPSTYEAISYAILAVPVRDYGSTKFDIPLQIPLLLASCLKQTRDVRTDILSAPLRQRFYIGVLNHLIIEATRRFTFELSIELCLSNRHVLYDKTI